MTAGFQVEIAWSLETNTAVNQLAVLRALFIDKNRVSSAGNFQKEFFFENLFINLMLFSSNIDHTN